MRGRGRYRRTVGTAGALLVAATLVAGGCTTEPAMPDFGRMGPDEAACVVGYGEDRYTIGPLGPSDDLSLEPDPLLSIRFGRTPADLVVRAERERASQTTQVPIAEFPSDGPGMRLLVWGLQDSGNPGVTVRCWRGTSTGDAQGPTDTSTSARVPSSAERSELLARSILRSCSSGCEDVVVFASADLPSATRDLLVADIPDVRFITEDERRSITGSGGLLPDGSMYVAVSGPYMTERSDVVRFDVSTSIGPDVGSGGSWLFVWRGEGWQDATPEQVDVTVTTWVS